MTHDIATLRAEHAELALPYFDEALAWRIGSYIQAHAASERLPIAVEVTKGGHRVFYCAMPGAMPDNADWIRKKRAVVERFLVSTLLMMRIAEESGQGLLEKFHLPDTDFVASGGGVAITLERSGCVGAVVVSGLTQFEDHDLGVAAIRAIKRELD